MYTRGQSRSTLTPPSRASWVQILSPLNPGISSRSIYGISSRLDLIYLRSEIETYTKSLPDSVTRYLLGNRFPYLRALIPLYKMPSWSAGGTIFLINFGNFA